MGSFTKSALLALLILPLSGVHADIITLPPKSPPPVATMDGSMPNRGISMAAVQRKYGKPKKKIAAIGDPPISRWVYDRYTVYFEHRFVIHSVPIGQ